jgi:hypothetical protein
MSEFHTFAIMAVQIYNTIAPVTCAIVAVRAKCAKDVLFWQYA